MVERLTGGCQCGAVRYALTGALGRASICHCRMCQKAMGNFFAPLVAAPGLTWTRGEPKRFRSSSKVQRGFCADCGTPLTYEPDGGDPEIAWATLDDANAVTPVAQLSTATAVRCFATLADLPVPGAAEEAASAPFYADLKSFQHPDHET